MQYKSTHPVKDRDNIHAVKDQDNIHLVKDQDNIHTVKNQNNIHAVKDQDNIHSKRSGQYPSSKRSGQYHPKAGAHKINGMNHTNSIICKYKYTSCESQVQYTSTNMQGQFRPEKVDKTRPEKGKNNITQLKARTIPSLLKVNTITIK